MKIRHEMWPLECLQTKCGRRTDGRRTKTGHKSSPEQSVADKQCIPDKPFHDNWTTNVTSRVKKTSPWRPYLGKNVSSRQFTCFHYIHKEKTAPPPGGHVFPLITTIFKLVRDIYIVNVLTDFRDN
ncbi:hypothetical protein DPMN_183721 [Dreissena polymorpha]|uniref:Uncharacterized protein n=1 Tax=Dreissena polymorpha TaxID=45954 RepID=A0A9D4I6L4_DREPO|nr:hypothetical protein DPMN_183721 [Dreissena polymorpha]